MATKMRVRKNLAATSTATSTLVLSELPYTTLCA